MEYDFPVSIHDRGSPSCRSRMNLVVVFWAFFALDDRCSNTEKLRRNKWIVRAPIDSNDVIVARSATFDTSCHTDRNEIRNVLPLPANVKLRRIGLWLTDVDNRFVY